MTALVGKCRVLLVLLLCLFTAGQACADGGVETYAEVSANASTGDFAPYFIGSLNHGKTTQQYGLSVDAGLARHVDPAKRYDFGYGAEVVAGLYSRNDYLKWDASAGHMVDNRQGPSSLWLQQLYAEIKFRTVHLEAGARDRGSMILSNTLSSGDLVLSGNARAVPQARAGFLDFVDVPFTYGWVQINGAVGYGVMPDGRYMSNHYNYYNYHLAKNTLYNYKFCYFRFAPLQRFTVIAGMQSAGMFGGKSYYYSDGQLTERVRFDLNAKSFFNMLMPVFNSANTFAEGSTLGTWDFYAQYRLRNESKLGAYFQWIFEDGSGIGRRNKLDGLWGLEYRGRRGDIVSGVVVEYLDFRDQSGPIHYAPGDYNHSSITTEATGRDNYYNNGFFNSFANYGMAMGTPFLLSPIYNLDGYPAFACTRANGVHVGVEGWLTERISYRALLSRQRGMGNYENPYHRVRTDTSVMLEGTCMLRGDLLLRAKMACDRGDLRGDNFGVYVSLSYTGSLDKLLHR